MSTNFNLAFSVFLVCLSIKISFTVKDATSLSRLLSKLWDFIQTIFYLGLSILTSKLFNWSEILELFWTASLSSHASESFCTYLKENSQINIEYRKVANGIPISISSTPSHNKEVRLAMLLSDFEHKVIVSGSTSICKFIFKIFVFLRENLEE